MAIKQDWPVLKSSYSFHTLQSIQKQATVIKMQNGFQVQMVYSFHRHCWLSLVLRVEPLSINDPLDVCKPLKEAARSDSNQSIRSYLFIIHHLIHMKEMLQHFQWLSYGGWRRGIVVNGFRRMNEVNACRARLVPGWVTIFGRV